MDGPLQSGTPKGGAPTQMGSAHGAIGACHSCAALQLPKGAFLQGGRFQHFYGRYSLRSLLDGCLPPRPGHGFTASCTRSGCTAQLRPPCIPESFNGLSLPSDGCCDWEQPEFSCIPRPACPASACAVTAVYTAVNCACYTRLTCPRQPTAQLTQVRSAEAQA